VIVPIHGKKDLPKGTFYAILKQAGLDKIDLF
jgi:predicted RNA binding protein YcfA (HicA-like mRNA interferase family)